MLAARDHAALGALMGAIALALVVVLGIAALGESGIPFLAENDRLVDLLPVSTFDVCLYAVLAALGFWAWKVSNVTSI
jgi:hypothetical protein